VSDEDEYVDELPIPAAKAKAGPRASVSAEAFGSWNRKEAFVPRVIPKTQEQKDTIIDRLNKAFMFEALDDKERDIVVNAMEERRASPGDDIII
jgi:cAMP-dependent protein kinase regulator